MVVDTARYGPWALVTGASSGIGEAFARTLAKEGLSVALVARRKELLERLASELRTEHGVDACVVVCDLAKEGAADHIADVTRDLDLGLVVSNAGTGHPGAFLKSDSKAERAILQLNATTPMELGRAFGRRLTSRGMGGLVFVSSAMAFHGAPYMATYAATKAYTLVFAESLHVELKPVGVDVLVVAPGPTDTPARHLYPIDWAKLPIKWMTPAAVVDATLSSLGKRALVVPGMRNQFIACIGSGLFIRSMVAARKGELTRKAIPSDWL